ncbi:type I secretion system permease/ATPase [Chitinibacter fontanus]|uniref:Cyclolysin secretion/processing ATP-binding protein CyaB n=1 Tax=Chitinibacter fontanus TaxID=1737446 RepID=A0A7D5Z509_9NEIS|nr:type I secretion system permease/ATPase [Chitinibacter fontanus]QLI81183.1 type I secretion system permease/ATPase [Chitinibacter fontanus]
MNANTIPPDLGGNEQPIDSALACLVMLARYHQIAIEPEQIKHEYASDQGTLTESDVLLAAKKSGLKVKAVDTHFDRLERTPLPAMAKTIEGGWVILAKIEGNEILIQDPLFGRPQKISKDEWLTKWSARLILFTSRASLAGDLARFDFSWFIPAIVKYRKLLGEVLLVSFVLQLIGLATPLFFQVIMDKVLVHRGLTTLDVLALGLLVISVFEVGMTALRTYVFSHTTNRIDVELGAKLFRHLLALPLAYFQARRVGDSVARVRELENIRNFLTGQALTSVLDLVFSVVFLAVMFYYSGWLTLIVVLSLPCYVLLSVLITPILKVRLDEKFARGAENQSFLVETINGVETIKSMAVEPQVTRRWDNQLAGYVAAGFKVTQLANIGSQGVNLIQKVVVIATMWIGAKLVIEGDLTVGQLIAFNMLAGRVASPVMRLAQLWQDFQQVGISMQRLGDILNTRTEINQNRAQLPPIQGHIEFDQIHFRYRPDAPEILRGINLKINAGEVIGIVGRSGSGKSTLTKLLQRLYVPERGRVLIDGVDLSLADPAWLRRQIGVVLQENLLFNRSIRDNIALADPGMSMDRVIYAAKLAGAHEFIVELPEGYDTHVGEHGTGLSGGQRQRVAIARALVTNPRILIFDEATSALDYESERIIQNNMKAICSGRTVLIIAHRLSAVRNSNRIIAMDRGQIVEEGPHQELVSKPDGYYARLHAMQMA